MESEEAHIGSLGTHNDYKFYYIVKLFRISFIFCLNTV